MSEKKRRRTQHKLDRFEIVEDFNAGKVSRKLATALLIESGIDAELAEQYLKFCDDDDDAGPLTTKQHNTEER